MKRKDINEGFTIVEVALVLAIAGLIFLMVFIALPAVQRTQRDAKRRDDVGALLTAIQKFQNNNRGGLPSSTDDLNPFLGSNFEDPKGFNYEVVIDDCGVKAGEGNCAFGNEANDESVSFDNSGYRMYVVKSAACDGAQAVPSNNPRKVAVLYKMEGSGGAYCASTQ